MSCVFQENKVSRVFQKCLRKFCIAILLCIDLIAATRAEGGLVELSVTSLGSRAQCSPLPPPLCNYVINL